MDVYPDAVTRGAPISIPATCIISGTRSERDEILPASSTHQPTINQPGLLYDGVIPVK